MLERNISRSVWRAFGDFRALIPARCFCASVTSWDPSDACNKSKSELDGLWDYGNKAWSGLVKDFYYKRYSIYADMLLEAQGKPVDRTAYATAVMRLACEFGRSTDKGGFPAAPVGDAFAIAFELWNAYQPQ